MIRARATFTAMLIVTVFAVGCDFVSSPEAQAVVDSTREAVQSIDKEKAQPGPDYGVAAPRGEIAPPMEGYHVQKPEIRGRRVRPPVVEIERPGQAENAMARMMREFETRCRRPLAGFGTNSDPDSMSSTSASTRTIDEESQRLMRRFEEESGGLGWLAGKCRRIEQEQFEAVRELETHREYLYAQLDEVYVSGDPVLQQLYVELEELFAELERDDADPETRESLVHKAEVLKKEIAGREEMASEHTQAIEEELFKVEHELDRLYRKIEVHYMELEDNFSRAMSRLDEERYALEDKRRMLEDEARHTIERLYFDTDNARSEAERRLRAALTDMPQPIERPTFAIEGKFEVKNAPVPDVESAFNEVRDTIEPLLGQAEKGVSALLEAAVDAAEDASSAATELVPH